MTEPYSDYPHSYNVPSMAYRLPNSDSCTRLNRLTPAPVNATPKPTAYSDRLRSSDSLVNIHLPPSPPLSPKPASAGEPALKGSTMANLNPLELVLEEIPGAAIGAGSAVSAFPVGNLGNCSLEIDAWRGVSSPGYKRAQLSFLERYASLTPHKGFTDGASRVARAHRRAQDVRRAQQAIARRRATTSEGDEEERQEEGKGARYESKEEGELGGSDTDRVRTRNRVKDAFATSSEGRDSDAEQAPKPKRKRTRPEGTTLPVAVVDYRVIEDFCPPTALLPNARCLKTEWKGLPMSLSGDPLLNQLHPAEIQLASILRLPCNLYLDSKRRLFLEKVTRMRKGLSFRRTDAQKACRIDVNKASRLFAAFEKVGWLSDGNFTRFMK